MNKKRGNILISGKRLALHNCYLRPIILLMIDHQLKGG